MISFPHPSASRILSLGLLGSESEAAKVIELLGQKDSVTSKKSALLNSTFITPLVFRV